MGTGTNQESVRRHNLGTLLRHVHSAGEISRAGLTSTMGLNRSTIAGLVTELDSLGLVHQPDSSAPRSGAGRPSAMVGVAHEGPFVVAVDLGVDRIVVARVGLGGVIHQRAGTRLAGDPEPWQVGSATAALIRDVVADAPATARMLGIGVSVPGLVRRSDGLVRLAPNLGWRDVSFGSVSWPPSVVTSPSRWPTTPTSARSPSTSAGPACSSTTWSTSPATSASAPASSRPAPDDRHRRVRRRGRPPAPEPGRGAVPLRQRRLLGDPDRRPHHRQRRSACPLDQVPALDEILPTMSSPRTELGRSADTSARVSPASSTC